MRDNLARLVKIKVLRKLFGTHQLLEPVLCAPELRSIGRVNSWHKGNCEHSHTFQSAFLFSSEFKTVVDWALKWPQCKFTCRMSLPILRVHKSLLTSLFCFFHFGRIQLEWHFNSYSTFVHILKLRVYLKSISCMVNGNSCLLWGHMRLLCVCFLSFLNSI